MTPIGRLLLVVVIVGIGCARTTFESDCNALEPPAYGIYDRGHCYVFVETTEHGWAEAQDVCTHLSGARSSTSRVNGGLAMWSPPTLLPIMNANPNKYETLLAHTATPYFLTGGAQPSTHMASALTGVRFDTMEYTQSATYEPRWPARMITRGLQTMAIALDYTINPTTQRECLVVMPGNMRFTYDNCDKYDAAWRGGFVCQYESSSRSLTTLKGNSRLNSTFVVETHTALSRAECINRLVACRACNSMAYSTSACELYIPDDRLETWDDAKVQDDDYVLMTYM